MKLVLRKTDKAGRFAVFANRKPTGLLVCKGIVRGDWEVYRDDDWLFTSTKYGCIKAIWCICDAMREVMEGEAQ